MLTIEEIKVELSGKASLIKSFKEIMKNYTIDITELGDGIEIVTKDGRKFIPRTKHALTFSSASANPIKITGRQLYMMYFDYDLEKFIATYYKMTLETYKGINKELNDLGVLKVETYHEGKDFNVYEEVEGFEIGKLGGKWFAQQGFQAGADDYFHVGFYCARKPTVKELFKAEEIDKECLRISLRNELS